jgi:hypothetical protein
MRQRKGGLAAGTRQVRPRTCAVPRTSAHTQGRLDREPDTGGCLSQRMTRPALRGPHPRSESGADQLPVRVQRTVFCRGGTQIIGQRVEGGLRYADQIVTNRSRRNNPDLRPARHCHASTEADPAPIIWNRACYRVLCYRVLTICGHATHGLAVLVVVLLVGDWQVAAERLLYHSEQR